MMSTFIICNILKTDYIFFNKTKKEDFDPKICKNQKERIKRMGTGIN